MKKVVFTFGRMNPPTTGHQLLVNKLVAYARQEGAAPRVYLSHSVGAKDPLQYDKKVAFARAAFGSLVKKSNARTVIEVLKSLEHEGYTHVTMFAGSDRVPEFTKLITKYNGKEYNFEEIEVKSAGERDPDADDVSGMSASKMRALAKDDKVAEFLRGAPNTLKAAQAKNMFTAVRRALLGEDVMDYALDEKFISHLIESEEKEDDVTLPTDAEIDSVLSTMGSLDLDDADALMLDMIIDGEDSDNNDMQEEARVLSVQARQKLSQRMKGMSKRLARLRQMKAKQMPASQRLRMRARKAALMILRKRATGKKNLDYNSLSRSQRIAVDNALVNRFGKGLKSAVEKISKRLIPAVRKKAQINVAKARDVKESYIFEAEKSKEGSARDKATDRIQAAKRGISVGDWEKTKADSKHDSPLNVDSTKLNNLDTDPTLNDRTAPNPKQAHLNQNRKLMHYARNDEAYVHEGRKSADDKDARDAGDTNIIYQMRKVVNSRGEHETVFADKHKASISIADAKKLLAKFDALRMPADKHEFTIQAGKSLASFRDVMAHGVKHDKKKISLGGRQFKEFYLGVGRTRTTAPFDSDEAPGTRRIAEVAKDEDRPDDPNKSRPLSQKMDLLLRLGLVDSDELQKFRRALRSSKKFALQSPELRGKLADLLDKLIDLTTKDPATYSRVRYNVVQKEAYALMTKAEKSGVDVDIIFEVFARGYEQNEDINEAFNRVNSFIAGGKAAEMDKDLSEAVKAPTGGLKDACWSGYTAVGMKMKGGRKVPNCVPKEAVSDAAKRILGNKAKEHGGKVPFKSTTYKDGKKVVTHGYNDSKGNRVVTHTTNEENVTEVSSALLHRAFQKAKKNAGWLMPGDKGKGDKAWNRAKKFRDAGVAKEKKEKAAVKEGVRSIARGNIKGREYDNDKMYKQNQGMKGYTKPWELSKSASDAEKEKAMQSFKGAIKKIPPGKKALKYIKLRDGVEQSPLDTPVRGIDSGKSSKKVFEQFRIASHKHPTGKTPYSDITNKKLRDDLTKKVKSASESYTGSEPVSGNRADPANRFVGTNAIRQNYASVTPGQGSTAGEIEVANFAPEKVNYSTSMIKKTRTEVDQSKDNLGQKHLNDIRKTLGGIRESYDLNESFAAGFELAPFARDYGIQVQSFFTHHPEVQAALDAQEDAMNEAIYQGRDVPLNQPMKGDVKKSKVYVRDPSTGNVKKVNFGDKKLSIKKDQPGRKRSYCARSGGQGNLTKKTSANYWSRRAWDC